MAFCVPIASIDIIAPLVASMSRCKRLDLRFQTPPDEITACHSSLGAKSWGQVLGPSLGAKLGPCDEWRNLTLTGRSNLDFTCQQTFVDTTKVAFAKLGACPWARQSRDPRDRKTPITAADLLV
jgi:hypothetical protein